MFGTSHWVFQQDGATAHTSNLAQIWCAKNFKYFLPKDKWPPNSPDINPVDYFYWNSVVTRMRKIRLEKVEDLEKEIQIAIDLVPTEEISAAVKSFAKRVKKIEENKGKYKQ